MLIEYFLLYKEDEEYGTKTFYGIPTDNILAWLEKQGEQESVIIIPKFRIGDEIRTTNEEPLTITKIDDKGYWSKDLFICGFDNAAKWELVEQKSIEWSEEDEDMLRLSIKSCERCGNGYASYWLNSLKERCLQQSKQEQNKKGE